MFLLLKTTINCFNNGNKIHNTYNSCKKNVLIVEQKVVRLNNMRNMCIVARNMLILHLANLINLTN